MFLRKTRLQRDPLAVTMSGVRLGERALQIGDTDARTIALIAAKCGLTGTAEIVVRDKDGAQRMQRAIGDVGAVADVHVVPGGELPFADAAFDAIVVHDTTHTISAADQNVRTRWLSECHRVLRTGGRIIAMEVGTAVGLRGLLPGAGKKQAAHADSDGATAALRAAGFVNVRSLVDREGVRFVEGLKAN